MLVNERVEGTIVVLATMYPLPVIYCEIFKENTSSFVRRRPSSEGGLSWLLVGNLSEIISDARLGGLPSFPIFFSIFYYTDRGSALFFTWYWYYTRE
jgi:hypothetical protein